MKVFMAGGPLDGQVREWTDGARAYRALDPGAGLYSEDRIVDYRPHRVHMFGALFWVAVPGDVRIDDLDGHLARHLFVTGVADLIEAVDRDG